MLLSIGQRISAGFTLANNKSIYLSNYDGLLAQLGRASDS